MSDNEMKINSIVIKNGKVIIDGENLKVKTSNKVEAGNFDKKEFDAKDISISGNK